MNTSFAISISKILIIFFILFSQNVEAQLGKRADLYQTNSITRVTKSLDFDNDGDLDIITLSGTDILYLEYLEDRITYAAPKSLQKLLDNSFSSSFSADITDFDNDLDLDFIVLKDNQFIWLENNNGRLTILKEIQNPIDGVVRNIKLVNMDMDNDLDILTTNTTGTGYVWFEVDNEQNIINNHPIETDSDNSPGNMYPVDMDGDGDFDIVTVQDQGSTDVVIWYRNMDGLGSFSAPIFLSDSRENYVNIADLDGDGDLDIILKDSNLGWLENSNGQGNFNSFQSITTNYVNTFSVGDINSDGRKDILTSGTFSKIQSYNQNNSGVFTGPIDQFEFSNQPIFNSLELLEINGDDQLDIVYQVNPGGNHELGYLENNDGQSWAKKLIYANRLDEIEIGDINGDNQFDIVIESVDGPITWLENIENNTFSTNQLVDNTKHYDYMNCEIIDWDNDGDNDIIGSFTEIDGGFSTRIRLFYENQNGTGSFTPRQEINTLNLPSLAVFIVNDMDNDGHEDLVTSSNDGIFWAKNINGQGSFNDYQLLIEDGYANKIADLNNDGLEDLISIRSFGQFGWYQKLDNTPNYSAINLIDDDFDSISDFKVTDIDLDNDLDIVLTTIGFGNNARKIFLYSNDGNGNFDLVQNISLPVDLDAFEYPIAVIDVDMDGDMDFVTSNVDEHTVWIENQNQFFSSNYQVVDSFMVYNSLTEIDADNDGDLDILATSEYHIALYKNVSDNPKIRGAAFYDINENAELDSTEYLLNGQNFYLDPTAAFAFTDSSNLGTFLVDPGYYDLSIRTPLTNWEINGDSVYTIFIDYDTVITRYFPMTPTIEFPKLNIQITSGLPRCNGQTLFWLSYQNAGTVNLNNSLVEFTLDSLTVFSSATPLPDSVSGNNYYWKINDLLPTYGDIIRLVLDMPSEENIGDTLTFNSTAFSTDGMNADTAQTNYSTALLCAYDPNDKLVSPSRPSEENYILDGEQLLYTIRFQNTGNDTAFNIRIEDQLDLDLDWSTFRPLSASHTFETTLTDEGMVTFFFNDILLPDSTTNFLLSQGYVNYSIYPKNGLPEATNLTNSASIFFDSNPPIITNQTSNKFTYQLPTSTSDLYLIEDQAFNIYPNPFNGFFSIKPKESKDKNYEIRLFDLSGKLLLVQQFLDNTITQIPVNNLPSGFFIYQILELEDGRKIQIGKIIAQ